MRLSLLTVAMVVWIVRLHVPARAQSGTDVSAAVLVHPDVPTILQLPDELEGVWSIGGGEVMVKGVGREVYLRPRPATPAGVEVFVEVKTRTLHRIFLVRVVERAEDARRKVVVSAPEAPPPPASAPRTTPIETQRAAVADTERSTAVANTPRFDVSVHAIWTLVGVTALEVPGYVPSKGRRSHRGFSLRLVAEPRDTWWSVEAGISGEWLDAPTVHVADLENMRQEEWQVSGPLLRADVGLRAGAGTRWRPTVNVRCGLQAHLRKIEKTTIVMSLRQPSKSTEDMPYGAVLTLGLGLQRQVGAVLLGVDVQIRQGVPADYRAVAALLSIGVFLDQGE